MSWTCGGRRPLEVLTPRVSQRVAVTDDGVGDAMEVDVVGEEDGCHRYRCVGMAKSDEVRRFGEALNHCQDDRFPPYLWKRHIRCLTDLSPDLMFKVCSTTAQRMPVMSNSFQAKMSRLKQRKLTRALSYLSVSVVPTRTILDGSVGSMLISLCPS
jgi:hypothetical protein